MNTIEKTLKASKATTTPSPEEELKRCAVAITEGKLPVYLAAADVQLLREICEAADIEVGADEYVKDIVGCYLKDSLKSEGPARWQQKGVTADILDGWVFEDADQAAAAMYAVVRRWQEKLAAPHN